MLEFAGVNPLGADVRCCQSLPEWQIFDVTSSLKGRDSMRDESLQLLERTQPPHLRGKGSVGPK